MNVLVNFISNITFDKKTKFGLIGIILCMFYWGLNTGHDFLRFLIMCLPAVLLIIPKDNIQYNKILSIICVVLLIISTIFSFRSLIMMFGHARLYLILKVILLIICNIYELFCALLLFIPNDGNLDELPSFIRNQGMDKTYNAFNNVNAGNSNKFCRECGAKLNADSAFCPECGKRV